MRVSIRTCWGEFEHAIIMKHRVLKIWRVFYGLNSIVSFPKIIWNYQKIKGKEASFAEDLVIFANANA